jgi:glycerol dehydrogenase-like iron-containing ADH family enzyme
MSNTDIRVVPGPANYFSHPGSLAHLNDFFTPEQLSRAVWIYGERAIEGAVLSCRRALTLRAQSICYLKATVASGMSPIW